MKKGKITIIAMLFALMACTITSFAGDHKVFGSHYAWNNNWNNNSAINVSFGTGSTPEMTVSYNFPSGNIYGYPAICRGWHYGWNPANDNLFPMQVSAASSIPCTFNFNCDGTDMKGNFAYDIFLRWDNAKSKPQLEVMVWGLNNSWPIGQLSASNVLTQGGITYDLWEGMNDAAGYYVYTFIPHEDWGTGTITQSGSLNVDMKPFLNWLHNNRSGSNRYSNSMYIDVIEAGIEVTGGNGWAYMNASINAKKSDASTTSYVQIKNRGTGLLIDGMGRTSNGSTCGQWYNTSSYNAHWLIESYNNYVRIKNRATGLYIDGYGRTSNGSICSQHGNSGHVNQQWTQESYNGYIRFKNRGTGLYLDGYGQTNNGADLKQHGNSGHVNQQWSLITVGSPSSVKAATTDVESSTESIRDIAVYPNPLLDGKLKINLPENSGVSEIKLVDLSGKILKQISTSDQSFLQMDVDAEPGVYMIQITTAEKNITKKLIVK